MKVKTTTKTVLFYEVGEAKTTYKSIPKEEKIKVTSSQLAAKYLRPYFAEMMETREEFRVIFLNRRNEIITSEKIGQGSAVATVVDIQSIFRTAILLNAQAIILSHNHPSNDTTPSTADKEITRKIKEAGKLFEIDTLDHIILTLSSYLSFADEGVI